MIMIMKTSGSNPWTPEKPGKKLRKQKKSVPQNMAQQWEEGVGMEAREVEGVGGGVKGGQLVGEGMPLMVAS